MHTPGGQGLAQNDTCIRVRVRVRVSVRVRVRALGMFVANWAVHLHIYKACGHPIRTSSIRLVRIEQTREQKRS